MLSLYVSPPSLSLSPYQVCVYIYIYIYICSRLQICFTICVKEFNMFSEEKQMKVCTDTVC